MATDVSPSSSRRMLFWIIVSGLAIGAVLVALAGCGSTTRISGSIMNPQAAASLAFVSNSGSGTVSAFMVSSSGGLTPISGSPFTAGAGAEFMAFDPVHNFLFVSNQSEDSLSVFSVKYQHWNAYVSSRFAVCHRVQTHGRCRGADGRTGVCGKPERQQCLRFQHEYQ